MDVSELFKFHKNQNQIKQNVFQRLHVHKPIKEIKEHNKANAKQVNYMGLSCYQHLQNNITLKDLKASCGFLDVRST